MTEKMIVDLSLADIILVDRKSKPGRPWVATAIDAETFQQRGSEIRPDMKLAVEALFRTLGHRRP